MPFHHNKTFRTMSLSMPTTTFYEIKWQHMWVQFIMPEKALLHIHYVDSFMFNLFRNPSFDPRFIRDIDTTTLMMDAISRNPNVTEKIVKNNSNLNWQYDLLFEFSKIPVETMLSIFAKMNFNNTLENDVQRKKQCILALQKHANLTLPIILAHPDFEWNWQIISKHKNISMNEIRKQYRLSWDWTAMSENPNLTAEMVLANPNKEWNWQIIYSRPFAFDLLTMRPLCVNDMDVLSKNPAITIEQIKRFENRHWNWHELSKNPAITLKDIIKNPSMLWKLKGFAENPNLTIHTILDNPDRFCLCMDLVTRNPAITKQNILDNPQIYWVFSRGLARDNVDLLDMATECKGITLDELREKYMNAHARYQSGITYFKKVSINDCKNISVSDIAKYNFVINLSGYLSNYEFDKRCATDVGISMEIIKQHPSIKWNWSQIVKNPFTTERENYVSSHVKRVLLATVLEFHETHHATSAIENVFADNHMIWCIMKY